VVADQGFGVGLRQPFGLSTAMRPMRPNCAATICTSFEGLSESIRSEEVSTMTWMKHYATAPSAWSSYLMNGDASELDDCERQWCDEWIKSLGLGPPVECEDAGFGKRHDAFAFYPKAARCLRYTFFPVRRLSPAPS